MSLVVFRERTLAVAAVTVAAGVVRAGLHRNRAVL